MNAKQSGLPDDLPLASEFPAATREQWLALVAAVLKGAAYEQKLVARTHDGLRIDALHARAADARPLPARALAAPWQVMQRVEHPDASAANAEALHDLENGATGLTLVFAGAAGAYGFGLEASENALARVVEGVHIDADIAIELDCLAMNAPQWLASLLRSRGISPQAVDIRFGFDPLGAMATGDANLDWSERAPQLAVSIADLVAEGFKGPFAAADARPVHAAGGSEAQELAFALDAAVAYLRTLEAGGITLDDARRMIFFRLAADADQFLTIAKFRALRKLWARVEEACGLAPQTAFVSAETAWRMMTQRDPWVNILRTTMATFSAGLGGANAIAAIPFTAAVGLPDRFARRIARNMQLILLEELNLAKVNDPAAGSGGIEDLTKQLCRAAWALFQEIEAEGGIAAALASGSIQQKVAAVREAREKAIATRRDALTGTSEFPHLAELRVAVLDAVSLPPPLWGRSARAERHEPGGGPFVNYDLRPRPLPDPPPQGGRGKTLSIALPRIRLAEPFERLRDASDRVLMETGARPRVFLATLGTPADFTARATFARNFFEAGGIEAISNDGFASPLAERGASPLPFGERSTPKASGEGAPAAQQRPDPSPGPTPAASDRPLPSGEVTTDLAALVGAFRSAGAKLVCLCSSDEVYAREAVEAAKALAAAGAAHIYLAGRPRELEPALRDAGVQTFIFAGCDALATLEAAHDILTAT